MICLVDPPPLWDPLFSTVQETEAADRKSKCADDIAARIGKRVALIQQQTAEGEEVKKAMDTISSVKASQASLEVSPPVPPAPSC